MKNLLFALLLVMGITILTSSCHKQTNSGKHRVLLDSDANNELDDQHAMAYLFFNGDVFDVVGITVNTTRSGGNIEGHYKEARRVMDLCNVYESMPLYKGADASFQEIRPNLDQPDFDGAEAVDFIIEQAHKEADEKLILLPVGKLTNIALALEKDPSIASKVRIVWLGSNYPYAGEYNQDNDEESMNYILNTDVPFEIVLVRGGKETGTAAVSSNRAEINSIMPGKGPLANKTVIGRHGDSFDRFGDYSVSLYNNIQTYDEAGTRPLYDMAAIAIIKDPSWAEKKEIPAPILVDGEWQERPDNPRKVFIWENFNKEAIMGDFFDRMENYVLVTP
ncbi:nucleoside hydrolase [Cyclobacterium amurskyense]|uniref:Putative inosine-uridine preferring nucleoside hydrolase n=1 Tax=Cyclobacterium amurskyense TaxID=320787 RepID=A0A0H4PVW0_9BACT|nr:nucleoside hydrolase [Cyclobacterium amurskyense]AKP52517.1 Putative inosine-uridine preferring nucleoside hydrolase [Cyclobacterium amurskyense]